VSLEIKKQRILAILSENLRTPQPQVLDSGSIAEILQMKVSEIQQVVKVLHQQGAVVSDLEGRLSLITPAGLSWLQEKSSLRA
jgi:hypothetical protein